MTELRKHLKAKRLEQGLSLRELSVLVGVSFSGLARVERGEGQPTQDTEKRIRDWLEHGVSAGPKPPKARGWIVTVEQRLARLEAVLGLSSEEERL